GTSEGASTPSSGTYAPSDTQSAPTAQDPTPDGSGPPSTSRGMEAGTYYPPARSSTGGQVYGQQTDYRQTGASEGFAYSVPAAYYPPAPPMQISPVQVLAGQLQVK